MHHLIKIALIALAAVAAFFVYGFTSQVAPLAVAVFAAGSLVSTYIGLAFARVPATQRDNAGRVATGAMVVEALYGSLYVLSIQYPAFFAHPPVWVAIPIAILHGAAFSVLAYFVSLFVVHEGSSSTEQQPAQTLEQALGRLLDRLEQPAALPDQAVYARPEAVATQPVLMPQAACDKCGHEASAMQLRTAQQHQGWRCPGCGSKVGLVDMAHPDGL